MSRPFVLGVDLGTTGVKVLLLPVDGTEADEETLEHTIGYPISVPHPGWSEQDPDDWWRATGEAIRHVLHRARAHAHQVAALAVSGQMHGATLLDRSGVVLRPCILWNDQRSAPQCDEITQSVSLEGLLNLVGNPALAGFTAPKLLWVREHEPEVYARVATVLLPKDYINLRLTGKLYTEYSDASGTLLFDVVHTRWSNELLAALDLSPDILPQAVPSTDIIGTVTAEAARHTGLAEGMPVVAGGADNACAAIGAGVLEPAQVLTSIGTSGTVVAPVHHPRPDPGARLHLFCHAVPDTWYLMGVVLSAGGSLRWFRNALAGEEQLRASEEGRDAYEVLMDEVASVPAGSERLIFLPYLTGERTPHGDPFARGTFVGLTPTHTRAHMARSVIEGVTFALADSVAIMRDMAIVVDSVRATGGGARSSVWRRIQSDVFDARVLLVTADAGPALGAALLAGAGINAFGSLEEATERFATVRDEIVPEAETVRRYDAYRKVYDELYPALRTNFRRLASLEG
ncbi:MAG TPA: xylulokinase [Chloroflexota bacterium]